MSRPSVCIITTVHSMPDSRIFFREALSLRQDGYPVSIVSPAFATPGNDEIVNVPIPAFKGRLMRWLRALPAAFRSGLRSRAKIIHFHDPELIPVGLLFRILGKKVVYDIHEDYPVQILNKEWIPKPLRRAVSLLVRPVESFCARFFWNIAPTEAIAARFPHCRIVRNLPRFEVISRSAPIHLPNQERFVVYAGALRDVRGIREMIAAVGQLERQVRLVLLGRWESVAFERECRGLPGWAYVVYPGHVGPEVMYGYMRGAMAGLLLDYPLPNYVVGLAIKGYEYMGAGIPIIMSDFAYWRESYAGCALFVNAQDAASVAAAIRRLLSDASLRSTLGQSGLERVRTELCWEREQHHLLDLYASLERSL